MIVLDSSAVISGLLSAGAAREALATEQVHVPHLVDSEIASVLRRVVLAQHLANERAVAALETWGRMGVMRWATHPLLGRIWELRDNLSAYDAGYVALAEALGCALMTADARLSRAPGVRCPIVVVPG